MIILLALLAVIDHMKLESDVKVDKHINTYLEHLCYHMHNLLMEM